jgi:Fe2+/Zn2+ uptake regulation proteins
MPVRHFSFQREQIYRLVAGTKEHPTAEMVYTRLKPAIPHLSLGTVYRNLHRMAEDGRLMELAGPVVRFDANTEPHAHFSCCRCGAFSDADTLYDAELDRAEEQDGRKVLSHSLIFYGICPLCMSKDKE